MKDLIEAVEELLDNREDTLNAEDTEMLRDALDSVEDDPDGLIEAVDIIVAERRPDYIHPEDREMLEDALASVR